MPSFRVDAVDPTAAGDLFTAALALGYVQTHDIFAAVRRANAAGALAATRMGAQPSLPKKEEIDAFLAAQKDRIKNLISGKALLHAFDPFFGRRVADNDDVLPRNVACLKQVDRDLSRLVLSNGDVEITSVST